MDHAVLYSQSEGWRSQNSVLNHKRAGRLQPRPQTATLRRRKSFSANTDAMSRSRPATASGSLSNMRHNNRYSRRKKTENNREEREFGRLYLRNLRILDSPRASFDSGNKSHPTGTISMPKKLPRSPSRRNQLHKQKRNASMKHNVDNAARIEWGLGRQFSAPKLTKEELQDSIFKQWINGYNDEKTEYRSTSVEIDTSFANASVFAESLPPANATVVSIAFTNFDKLIRICGRYRRQLQKIRQYLVKAIYIDHKKIPIAGEATIEQYAKTPTFFGSSADLAVELEVTKFELNQIKSEHASVKDKASKHKRTSFARMFMHAADKSKNSRKTSELEAKLQVHDDHMHKLHTKTFEMIVSLLQKLEPSEQLNLVETIFKHFNLMDTTKFIQKLLLDHKDFDEAERSDFIVALTSPFTEEGFVKISKIIINSLGGRSKVNALFDIITGKLSASARQALLVDILLSDSNDRENIFSRFFQVIENEEKLPFSIFAMENLYDTQVEKVRIAGKLLKHFVGIAPDSSHLKHFAHDVVQALDSNRTTKLNAFQNALLEELVGRCEVKIFRKLSSAKAKKYKERKVRQKSEKATKTKENEEKINVQRAASKKQSNVTVVEKQDEGGKENGEVTKEKKSSTLTKDTEEVAKAEKVKSEEPPKTDISSEEEDDEGFDEFMLPKRVQTRTIETQTDPMPDLPQVSGGTGDLVSTLTAKTIKSSRVVKDMRPFAAVLQFENKEGKPLTYRKTLALIYTTYANKIVADKTADRNNLSRESIGNFILRSFKNEYGLEKRVSLMLAGLIKSINKFKSRSRRIEQFSELCGLELDQEYSTKTCDIYLNIAKSVFPKFNKGTLVKQGEGSCKITYATAKKALHRVFPRKKAVKFAVGRMKLREDIFEELMQTVARIATPKVDFDIMVDCCLEASIRQFSLNVEILKDMFVHYKKDNHEHLHRENFDELMKICAEGITEDELDKIWEETHQYKVEQDENETLNPEIFSHICSLHGIAPPTGWRPPNISKDQKANDVQQEDVGKEDEGARRSSSFGILTAGFKLKALSKRTKERMQIPLIARMCQTGSVVEVERLLEEEADINEKDHRGTTPLMHASWWGHIDVVKLLIESGADLNQRNGRWNTALHFAYEEKHEDIVKLLVEAGAASMKNKIGIIPEDFLKVLKEDDDDEENDGDEDVDEDENVESQ